MFKTSREDLIFCVWTLVLLALIAVGARVATLASWAVPLAILIPLGYCWISTFFVSWTKRGWPMSPRMFLGLLVGGVSVIWLVFGLTVGWVA